MLDKFDKHLLFELDRDSRQSLTALSKKLMKSKEFIYYRINRLVEQGILVSYEVVINIQNFGQNSFGVYFRSKKIDEKKEQEILNYFINHQNVTRVSQSIGEFDISIAVVADNVYQFDQIFNEIKNKYKEELSDAEINIRVVAMKFNRNYLVHTARQLSDHQIVAKYEQEKRRYDDLDKKILMCLSDNLRQSSLEIARQLKISNATVISRIKHLKSDGIIKAFTIFLNNSKMGYECYRLLIKVSEFSEQKEKELVSYCEKNPNVIYYIRGLGLWNIEIVLEVENVQQFQEIYREIRTLFSQNIVKMSSLVMHNNLLENTICLQQHTNASKQK